jgi:hypothetical protein
MPERRRSWLRLPVRAVEAYFKPAAAAFDVESIRRAWQWAQEGQRRAGARAGNTLPVVENADGTIDLVASAASIPEYAEAQFRCGRTSAEAHDVMARVTPDQVAFLIGWQQQEARRRLQFQKFMALAAVAVAFGCLFLVGRIYAAILSASFFFLLAGCFGLGGVLEARDLRRRKIAQPAPCPDESDRPDGRAVEDGGGSDR